MIKQFIVLLGLCVVLSFQINDNTNETEYPFSDLLQASSGVNISSSCGSDCSSHGSCLSSGECQCDFGYTGMYCQHNWKILYDSYVFTFSILFAFIATLAGIQYLRFLFSEGCHTNTAKTLHMLFFVVGTVRVVWLQLDPHNLKGTVNAILENLLYGFGLYVIVLCYLLIIMLWAVTYKNASLGRLHSPFLKHVRGIIITLIIAFGVLEVVLRVLWKLYDVDSTNYIIIVGLYYLMMIGISIFVITCFLFYGLRLYRNLIEFQGVHQHVKDRLTRITLLTVGVTVLSIITVVTVVITFALELILWHFKSDTSFLVEQFIFRGIEVSLSFLVLYGLRKKSEYPPKVNEAAKSPPTPYLLNQNHETDSLLPE